MFVLIRKILIFAVVFASVSCMAEARAAVDIEGELEELTGVEALEAAAPDMPGDIDISTGVDYSRALEEIFNGMLEKSKSLFKNALISAVLIIICSYLCSTVQCAFPDAAGYVSLAGIAAITIIFTSSDSGLIAACNEVLSKIRDFSNVLLPVLAASAVAAGEVASSAVRYEAAALFFNVLTNIAAELVIPLIYAFIAASVAEAATGNKTVGGAAGLLKWLSTILLTCVMLIFIFYLSVGAIVTGSADAAAVRVAKTTISTTFPIVGNIASDAASALLSSAALIKSTVGAFGLIAVLALCASPFVEIGLHYLLFKAASKLIAESEDGCLAKLTGRFSEAFGLLLACIGASAVMMFFSIFSFMRIVT
jgi:stage III sporulation protein AE